jgi:hypothetical protein
VRGRAPRQASAMEEAKVKCPTCGMHVGVSASDVRPLDFTFRCRDDAEGWWRCPNLTPEIEKARAKGALESQSLQSEVIAL